MRDDKKGIKQNALVYWIGPIAGGIIAALLYEYVFLRPWRVGEAGGLPVGCGLGKG